jgi:hypothetical protein
MSLVPGCTSGDGDETGDPSGPGTSSPTMTDPTSGTTGGPTSDPTGSPTGDPTSGPTGDPTSDPTGDPTASTEPDPTTGGTESTTGDPPACADPALWDAGLAPSAFVHVAGGGADGPGCGAEQSPCATIAGGIEQATPGTAVVIHAGNYAADLYLDGVQGSEGAPIWIGGAEGEARPVIAGGGEAIHLTRPRYLILHDLEITGASGNGINIDDGGQYDDEDAARYLGVRRVAIHDIGGGGNEDCLKLSGLNDYFVVDSEFRRCGGGGAGSGIDHVGCHRGTIARNHFEDISGNAVQSKGGSFDIEIRYNLMIEAGERGLNMGGSTGFEFFRPPLSTRAANFEARDIRAVANVIVGGNAALAYVGCVDCVAINNTIVRPHNWIFRILQETTSQGEFMFLPSGGGVFRNNLVYFERADLSTYVNIGGDTDPASFSFASNLWYAFDDPNQSNPGGDLPTAESGGIVGQDPLLTDPASGDFTLQPGSPAAGAALDRAGVCFADPPSIGAYEAP